MIMPKFCCFLQESSKTDHKTGSFLLQQEQPQQQIPQQQQQQKPIKTNVF